MNCMVAGDTVVVDETLPPPSLAAQQGTDTELTEASKALLYGENEDPAEINNDVEQPPEQKPRRSLQALVLSILLLIAVSVAGVAGVFLWHNLRAPDNLPETPTTTPDS